MKSKLKSISLSNWINRSPVLNLQVFGIVQPDASYKETKKRKTVGSFGVECVDSNNRVIVLKKTVS